ncbi:MAG: hypothetical protein HZA02_05040 [Nitrospinae bacterium]|nr:hypothetical protein [Nitrospinota bacterium]
MLYEVRVLDAEGKIKNVISSEELTRMFWKKFEKDEATRSFVDLGGSKIPSAIKRVLDIEFFEFRDTE